MQLGLQVLNLSLLLFNHLILCGYLALVSDCTFDVLRNRIPEILVRVACVYRPLLFVVVFNLGAFGLDFYSLRLGHFRVFVFLQFDIVVGLRQLCLRRTLSFRFGLWPQESVKRFLETLGLSPLFDNVLDPFGA